VQGLTRQVEGFCWAILEHLKIYPLMISIIGKARRMLREKMNNKVRDSEVSSIVSREVFVFDEGR